MGGKKKEFELTLEIGHRSAPLKSKSPNGYTHKWTVFVRGVNDSNIEYCVQKVVFQLHESFDNPLRHISTAPFEITETGYAGFEIPMEIFFKNKEKRNSIDHIHDLCLLQKQTNDATSIKKVKFINPTKEFERLLQKSGAQLLKCPTKKERSDSPPAKKQKSSSLIPSKDMSRQSQSQPQPANHVQDTLQTSSSSNNRHQTMQSQSQPPKTSSKQFIDVFGAPLLYHSNNPSSSTTPSTSASTTTTSTYGSTTNSNSNSLINNSLLTSQSTASTPVTSVATTKHNSASNHSSSSSSHNNVNYNNIRLKADRKDEHFFYLQSMQSKISCISDSDRLQRIVDIVEGAGEWYNVTPKKFEFDLKRLDRKTLVKIERCLQH